MERALQIEGDLGGCLIVKVRGYENEQASNPDDANWLRCRIELSSAGFSGSHDCSLMTYDFDRFSKEVEDLIASGATQASFRTDEDHLRIQLERTPTGSIKVSGALQNLDRDTALQFAWNTDLSRIESSLGELQTITSGFPIKK